MRPSWKLSFDTGANAALLPRHNVLHKFLTTGARQLILVDFKLAQCVVIAQLNMVQVLNKVRGRHIPGTKVLYFTQVRGANVVTYPVGTMIRSSMSS
jgi:hypothetical protein